MPRSQSGPLLGAARHTSSTVPATTGPRPFVKVPFNHAWVTHDKLDLKGIYRRPRFVEDKYGESHREYDPSSGAPTWDLTSGLPIRHHARWSARGFQFVTLASQEDLLSAARAGTLPSPDPRDTQGRGSPNDYQNHRSGPWNAILYLEAAKVEDADLFAALKADVEKYGPAAVEEIRRRLEPGFELPDALR